MSRIAGVKFLGLAPITYTNGVPTFGDVIELKQFISFSTTKNYSDATWYSNDVPEEVFSGATDIDLTIVVGRLDGEIKAQLAGSDYTEKGVLVEKADDVQNEFALIVILSQLPSGTFNQVYYRVKLKVDSVEGSTKTDSIEDKQVTITGKALPDYKGRLGVTIDSNDAKADTTVVNNWKTAVYDPDAV